MDPLTQFVDLLRPKALGWKHMGGTGDWALRFPSEPGIVFGAVMAGSCRLDVPGMCHRQLHAGDYLLLVAPPSWMLSDGVEVTPVEFDAFHNASIGAENTRAELATRIVGGHFVLDTANADLLTTLLRPLVHVRAAEDAACRLHGILNLVDDEALSDRLGQDAMLARLLEAMLIEILRSCRGPAAHALPGLLTGLEHPRIATALRAMHADTRRGWTVATLASCAGMSRSVFAHRFRQLVGMAPLDYLRRWRMARAKDALRFSDQPLSEIAFASGYASASAFNTAFTGVAGRSPGAFRIAE